MRRDFADRLAEIEVVGEFGALGLFALHDFRRDETARPKPLAQIADELGVLADALDQNEARPIERRLDIGHALLGADELLGLFGRVERGIAEQRIGQRLESGFASHLSLGSPLRLEGRVDIFEIDFGVGSADGTLKFGRQLALLGRCS